MCIKGQFFDSVVQSVLSVLNSLTNQNASLIHIPDECKQYNLLIWKKVGVESLNRRVP